MIEKETFIDLIKDYNKYDLEIDKLCSVFSTAFDSYLVDFGWRMFEKVMSLSFTTEGVDWINYFLHENIEKGYYIDGAFYVLEDIYQLWDLVKEYRK